jgi:hypothetical protein
LNSSTFFAAGQRVRLQLLDTVPDAAAATGRPGIADILINHYTCRKADPHFEMVVTAQNGQLDVVERLLAAKVDVNANPPVNYGCTVL